MHDLVKGSWRNLNKPSSDLHVKVTEGNTDGDESSHLHRPKSFEDAISTNMSDLVLYITKLVAANLHPDRGND